MDLLSEYAAGSTLTQLSTDFGMSVDRIRSRLKRAGVYKQTKQYKCDVDEHYIIALYKQDVSVEDIALKCGTSPQPVVRALKKHNVRKPNRFKTLPYALYEQVTDKQFFQSVIDKHVSNHGVQQALCITRDMVATLCKFHNISMPNSAEVKSILKQQTAKVAFTHENFIQLHHQLHEPLEVVSKKMGVSVGYLRKTVKEQWNGTIAPQGETRLSAQFRLVRNNPEQLKQDANKYTVAQLQQMYQVSYDKLKNTLDMHNIQLPFRARSVGEQQVCDMLDSCGIQYITNNRSIIPPYELDIYIPSHNMAIEYCGLYWHSEANGKDKNYHITKHQLCEKHNIRLFTIFEDEWLNTARLCTTRIQHALGIFLAHKLDARQCTVSEIDNKTKNQFLNAHHLQGSDVSAVRLGLFYNSALVAVMTFAKPSRARQSAASLTRPGLWELNRYATDSLHHVRGGAGKLITHFKRHYHWEEIYSYADIRWSVGSMYHALGFELISTSKPNYWYLAPDYKHREYRFAYTKASLVKRGYCADLTESQIMEQCGYSKIWDCGMLKFAIAK